MQNGKWIERRECTECNVLVEKCQKSAKGHSEQWVDQADNERQGCCGTLEGNTMWSEGNHCHGAKAVKNISSKDEIERGTGREKKGQHDDQAKVCSG